MSNQTVNVEVVGTNEIITRDEFYARAEDDHGLRAVSITRKEEARRRRRQVAINNQNNQ
jgi:hypothetical protein